MWPGGKPVRGTSLPAHDSTGRGGGGRATTAGKRRRATYRHSEMERWTNE